MESKTIEEKKERKRIYDKIYSQRPEVKEHRKRYLEGTGKTGMTLQEYLKSDKNPFNGNRYGFKNGHNGFMTETIKKKISLAHKGMKKPWVSLHNKLNNPAKYDGEWRRKHKEGIRKKWNNKNYRKWRLEILRTYNTKPEFIRKRLLACNIKPNKPENILIKLFKQNNIPYKYVGDGEVIIGGKNPDFINCNGQKKIIELFGNWWHLNKRDIPWKQTEFGTRAIYSQYGFKTLVIWEHELNDINSVLENIKKFER